MSEDEFATTVLTQVFELWVNPEIARRRSGGSLPPDFELRGAQVIMNLDRPPVVRLNDEVKAVLQVTATRSITKGEAVGWSDFEGDPDVLLTPDDANAGHVTILRRGDGWFGAFDFHYNAGHASEHSQVASDFLATAAESLKAGRKRPFVDNLSSAVELMAKTVLLQAPDGRVLGSKSHQFVHKQFDAEGKSGGVPIEQVELLNRLWALRKNARYLDGDFEIDDTECTAMLRVAREMEVSVRSRIPPRWQGG